MNTITRSTGLGDDQVRDSARDFATRQKDLARYRSHRHTPPGYRSDALPTMRALGWFGTLIAERDGGFGMQFADMAAILEELGRSLLAEPLAATAVYAVRVLTHAEPGGARSELLDGIASGRSVVAVAASEQLDMLDVTTLDTRVRQAHGQQRLHGRKRFVTGACEADTLLVSAREDGGIAIYRISAGAPGVTLTHEWRIDGTASGIVDLNGVLVTAADRICSPGAGATVLVRAIDETAVMAAAELQGVMTAALDLTLDYMRLRVQFDRPIASFQALQHRAAELYLQIELSAAAIRSAVAVLDDTEADPIERSLAVSRAKSRCSDAGTRIGRDAVQLHGAIGFTDECDVGLYLKRAMVLSGWCGTPSAHRRRATRVLADRPSDADRVPAPNAAARAARDRQLGLPAEQRDWAGFDDDAFRSIAADLFASHLPAHLKYLPRRPYWNELKDWYCALGRLGWIAPAWPTRYGGMGLSPGKQLVYSEELGRSGAPRHLEQGINYIGPLLIARGTDSQKARFLPRILSGEHLWCQGYSEPNAGSDLASLRTEARLEGDEFVINGEKIWTTMAHQANHMYALVRTAKGARKHDGISLLLIDMNQPGLAIRPIRNIAGHEEFCQVTLTDVRTPVANLVGAVNDGWQVARTLLGFERSSGGSPRLCQLAYERLEIVARSAGLLDDPVFREKLTEVWMEIGDLGSLYERFAQAVRDGATPGAEVSAMKIWATETLQRITELMIEAAGEGGSIAGAQPFGDETLDITMPFLDARSLTISAGSSQIQRNLLAKRVLKL